MLGDGLHCHCHHYQYKSSGNFIAIIGSGDTVDADSKLNLFRCGSLILIDMATIDLAYDEVER